MAKSPIWWLRWFSPSSAQSALSSSLVRPERGSGIGSLSRIDATAPPRQWPGQRDHLVVLRVRGLPVPGGRPVDLVVLQQRRRRPEPLRLGVGPLEVVGEIGEPSRVVSRRDGGLEQAVGAGENDIGPRRDIRPGGRDQDVVAQDLVGVDPVIVLIPGLVDAVGLGRPVIEVPGLFWTLGELLEGRFDGVALFGADDSEGVPALVILAHLGAVFLGSAARSCEVLDRAVIGLDGEHAAEPRGYIYRESLVPGPIRQSAAQRDSNHIGGLRRGVDAGRGRQHAQSDREPTTNEVARAHAAPQ